MKERLLLFSLRFLTGEVEPLNPYKNLISNTVLFGISTFGARFLTFLLTPFYTRVLSSTEYGITDLLIQTGNLIIPIASVGIANGVIRYGLERSTNKNSVFTIGFLTTIAGVILLLLVSPILDNIPFLTGYVWLILLYVLAANIHSVCNQFARSMGHIRFFALDGVLRTVLTILFNILLLAVFPMGVTGYVLANVLADGITTAFVFVRAKQWRYFHLASFSRQEAGRMLRYSAPLVPSTLCSWIINISDRYLIAPLIGNAATGIYAVANKVPTILLTVANTFTSAWQISALAEQPKKEKEHFFSNVYATYSAIAFVTASGVILTAQLSTRLLAAPEYYEAWRYVPILTLATTFACLGSFLSSIYMVEQRSTAALATTMIGAVCNLVGNFFLIQLWEAMGAAISTLLSYILIFAVRAIHTQTMLRIQCNLFKLLISVLILGIQCILVEKDIPLWPVFSSICLLLICTVHFKAIMSALRKSL